MGWVFCLWVVIGCAADDTAAPTAVSGAGRGAAAVAGRSGVAGGNAGSNSLVPVGTGVAGIGAAACPALRPVEDATCTTHTRVCTYDEIECRCPAGAWSCAEPVDPNCPAMMPAHGSVCTAPEATECEFLQDECECTAGRWSCELFEDAGTAPPATTPPMTMPDAGMPPAMADAGTMVKCPDLRPVEGFSCTPSRLGCMYDTTHCVCPMGMWLCNERVDPRCPIEPPSPGSACTGNADCDYFDMECECLRSTWQCKAND